MLTNFRSSRATKIAVVFSGFLTLGLVPAAADTVTVAPSISVTRRTFDAPINEQPFFGFAAKSETQTAADRKFIETFEKQGDRKSGAIAVEKNGWDAIWDGDYALAARRLNQAWLLDPGRSPTVHGFAMIADRRFKDREYAEELFRLAATLKTPLPTLEGDHARLYLALGEPGKAIPLLETALKKIPSLGYKIDLAKAYRQAGDLQGACRMVRDIEQAMKAEPRRDYGSIATDARRLGEAAKCALN